MTGRFRIGIAAAVALLLTSSGLLRLLEPSTWIWPVIGVVMVSTAAGELARRLIRPRPLVIVAQLAAVFWYDTVLLAHEVAFGGLLPTWAVFHRLGDLYRQGADDIQHTFPGGPVTPGIAAILVLSLGALAVLVDALAATYAVAPLAGLPLLALYLVPATRVSGGMDWLAFTLAAAGYTALLSAEGRERLGRWGRPLVHAGTRRPAGAGPDGTARPKVDTGPIAATGHQITMFALIAAVLAPLLLPTVSSGLFGLGPAGSGGGGGDGTGTATLNQSLDLKANLLNQTQTTLFTYQTSDGAKEYLRLGSYDDFRADQRGNAWVRPADMADRPLQSGTLTDSVPGLTVAAGTVPTVKTSIKFVHDTITKTTPAPGQSAGYSVPAPYPAQSVAGGSKDWQFDPTLSIEQPQMVKKNLQYTVTSFDSGKVLTEAQFQASAPITDAKAQQLGLSRDLDTSQIPDAIKAEALRVVNAANAKTPIDKARALNAYFHDSKLFKYSLTDVVPGEPTGRDALLWMLDHKSGYCQYFASAMAAMARSVGVPARLAIGFTGGVKGVHGTDPSAFTVTTHDYHAWPELYFDGIGWLRFEPTVGIEQTSGGGNGIVPAYAVSHPGSSPSTAPSTQSSGVGGPTGPTSSSNCSAAERKAGDCPAQNTSTASGSKDAFGYLGWFGAVPRFFDYWLFGGSIGAIVIRFVLLLLFLVACVPMAIRVSRRRGRFAVGRRAARRRQPDAADALEWQSADADPVAPTDDPERLRILAAWAEVRDSATDLGYPWPPSETPRQTAERIIKQARFAPPAQDAMDRITGLAERASYARTVRPGTAPATLFDDVRTIRGSLAEPVSRRTRIRATVLPPSALAALRERREDLTGRVYERVQTAGARLRPKAGKPAGRKR